MPKSAARAAVQSVDLFVLSTPEVESLLERCARELSARKHAGDIDAVRVLFVQAAHVAEVLDFAVRPLTDRPATA